MTVKGISVKSNIIFFDGSTGPDLHGRIPNTFTFKKMFLMSMKHQSCDAAVSVEAAYYKRLDGMGSSGLVAGWLQATRRILHFL